MVKGNHNSEFTKDLFEAAKQAGLPEVSWNQRPYRELEAGIGFFHLNRIGPKRASSSVAYLHPLNKLPKNFTLRCNTVARKILFEKSGISPEVRAVGIETTTGEILHCTREVILACGAFDTPKLLLLSGIGPKWHLRERGIPLVVDLPGVGDNLIDHPEGWVYSFFFLSISSSFHSYQSINNFILFYFIF
jgi:Choline dehydrogenase and related flavoproteins